MLHDEAHLWALLGMIDFALLLCQQQLSLEVIVLNDLR